MKARPIVGIVFPSLIALLISVPSARSAVFTWDGGGADGKVTTPENWVDDVAPNYFGETLVFAGSANLSVDNDYVTVLSTSTGPSITFASGAGSFNIGGGAITMGSSGGGGLVIISQQSANPQTIGAGIYLSGGNGDRSIVFGAGAGSLTLSGDINFSNDWLFPTTTAGTIVLSGNNTGDGKATAAITAGTNTMRAMMRNNVDNTQLVLGSDAALGNAGSGAIAAGTAAFRGVLANKNLYLGTAGGVRTLPDSTLAINTGWLDFNGAGNLTIGNLVSQAGNRDFKVSGSGQLTVQRSLSVSADQTSRQLYLNLSGTGGMEVSGSLHDTFHSGGIATQSATDVWGGKTNATLRKAGAATLYLNGDSGTTFTGEFRIENGKVVLGHPNALGAAFYVWSFSKTGATTNGSVTVVLTDSAGVAVNQSVAGEGIPEGTKVSTIDTGTHTVTLSQPATADGTGIFIAFSETRSAPTVVGSNPNLGTLDLNGQTIAEPIHKIEGAGPGGVGGALVNGNAATPAAITENLTGVFNFSIDGPGDITVPRLIATGNRVVTKNGTGTFTTSGTSHNNLCGWVINSGTVVFANTAGFGSDRGTVINGGVLRLSGSNPNLINDTEAFTLNGGTFDLNGKSEAVNSINGTGGTITNGASAPATLYVGGGVFGTAAGSFAGAIQDGTGPLSLMKEGSGTQTLTGSCAYTGDTSITKGTLGLAAASLADGSTVSINSITGANLNLAHTDTDTVAALVIDSVSQPEGVYGAVESGAEFETPAITGTGRIRVVAATPSGYSGWAAANAPGQAANLDHDGDGVPNGVEYFMGETGSGFTANPAVTANAVTWPKIPDFSGSYQVQSSTDLQQWDDVASTATATSVTYQLPGSQAKIFVRLSVTPD